jgi:hypothetical protein
VSDNDQQNITSPRSGGPNYVSGRSGGAIAVADRPDILHRVRASGVGLRTDPARPDVIIAEFWSGDHRSHGANAHVTETNSEVNVEIFVGVLPEAEGRPASAIAELQRLSIHLSTPLAGRRLTSR